MIEKFEIIETEINDEKWVYKCVFFLLQSFDARVTTSLQAPANIPQKKDQIHQCNVL